MDVVMGLPRTLAGHDAIWVIVDRLTKSAYFLPVLANYPLEKFSQLYIQEKIRLHRVPSTIISDRDPRLTSWFCGALQKEFGTRLCLSTHIILKWMDDRKDYSNPRRYVKGVRA